MKWLRYISVFFLCSLVIYTGAGVALMQFCCQGCRDMQAEHNLFCQMQQHTVAESGCRGSVQTGPSCCCAASATCEAEVQSEDADEEGCTVEIYKPDWLKQAFSPQITLPVCDLWFTLSPVSRPEAGDYLAREVRPLSQAPPLPGREYLALYSTLLI